jgi:hypothetical protein
LVQALIGSRPVLIVLAIVWTMAVGTGMALLWNYEVAPGVAATAPARWPESSRIARATDRPTLLMLLHPQCPCSKASLEELDRLMARVHHRVAARVLFVIPPDAPEDWARTDLWRQASGIRGVSVVGDRDALEAERFHAATSGEALLYGTDGRLLFSGGITGSRGHAGDNTGRSALLAFLTDREAATRNTPVFGCSLLGEPGAPF